MLKKIISIGLSVLLLGSNAMFGMATHYCHGEFVGSKLVFGNAGQYCQEQEHDLMCKEGSSATVIPSKCCENHYTSFKSGSYTYEIAKITPAVSVFVFEPLRTYEPFLRLSETPLKAFFPLYCPPLIPIDRQALYQVFLI